MIQEITSGMRFNRKDRLWVVCRIWHGQIPHICKEPSRKCHNGSCLTKKWVNHKLLMRNAQIGNHIGNWKKGKLILVKEIIQTSSELQSPMTRQTTIFCETWLSRPPRNNTCAKATMYHDESSRENNIWCLRRKSSAMHIADGEIQEHSITLICKQ